MRLRHTVIVLALVAMLLPLGSLSLGVAAGPVPLVVPAMPTELPAVGDAARGQQLYGSFCAGCHAPEAALAPQHNGAELRTRYPTDESIAAVIRSGPHPMPGFTRSELGDQALADVVSYIWTLKQAASSGR